MVSQADDPVVGPLVDDIQGQVMRTIETFSSLQGQPRELLCVDFGKALVLLGCNFIGNALGLDADEGLQPGRDCIERFRAMVEAAQKASESNG